MSKEKTVSEIVSKKNPIQTKVLDMIGMSYPIEEKPFMVIMKSYFDKNEFACSENITSVSAIKTKDEIKLMISTHKVGALIGTRGKIVAGLRESIKECLGVKVNIKVMESTLWKM